MFTKKSVLILVASAIVATIALYYIDSDPPSDGIGTRIINTIIVFTLITIVYAIVYSAGRKFRQ